MHSQESIVKSIVYGNVTQTSYGMMRALCSAINTKDHIDKIILYLRSNVNFQKYNKFIFAFRLEQISTDLFITDHNAPVREKFLEGYNDDTGLEGNGQKLLALLQKFNVRNVLVIIALRQRDPLREFNSEHSVQIVKCGKDLLSSLYDKVVMSKTSDDKSRTTDIIKQPIQSKQYVMPLMQFIKKDRPTVNPNYVGKQYVRRIVEPSHLERKKPEIIFLNKKIKELAMILEEIIERFGENEDAQVKFAIRYDKNKTISKVFQLFAVLFGYEKKQDLLEGELSTHLKSITSRNLTANVIRKLNEELMSNKSLRSELVVKENKVCGILMEFLQVLLKSYSFAKKLAIIESEIEQQDEDDAEIVQASLAIK